VKVKKELEVVHEWFVLVEGENVIGHLLWIWAAWTAQFPHHRRHLI
jgi:hypothetical protein